MKNRAEALNNLLATEQSRTVQGVKLLRRGMSLLLAAPDPDRKITHHFEIDSEGEILKAYESVFGYPSQYPLRNPEETLGQILSLILKKAA